MNDPTPEELAHDMKRISTEESELQTSLFDKWQSTLVHKNGIEVLKTLSERLMGLTKDLEVQQAGFRTLCERMERGEDVSGVNEDDLIRALTGTYVWVFKISESICANAGRQLYDLIDNTELHERIANFQPKPAVKN